MAKNWDDLTQAEKIEDLRRDVVRIFDVLRQFQDVVANDERVAKSQAARLDQLGQLINGLHTRLEKVETNA